VTIHDLRRSLGSWLASEGHSLLLIGRALGHQSSASTQIYARLALAPLREALERNASLMLGRPHGA
jgi:integrase